VESDAQEDKCGICHGNGEQCDTYSGVYEKEQGSGKFQRNFIILVHVARKSQVREVIEYAANGNLVYSGSFIPLGPLLANKKLIKEVGISDLFER